MNDVAVNDDLSPAKRALLEIRELRTRLRELEAERREPVAVVGIGCRLPGANGPDAFFEMLMQGTDAVREVPRDRWDVDAYYDPDPDVPGRIATRWGGFLDGVDQFEAQLFGVSPREAETMDPQQRLLLEVGWEALEHAGCAPDRMRGTRTGVFVGIGTSDYAQMQLARSSASSIDAYLATGSISHSVASGRLAYYFGFQGPAISIDTACSSSLVSIHLACQSLRAGECSLALAGGVNAILSPENSISLSKARMMAADGRCKTFDARADGFVRGEGCGLVVLKRLSDAIADHDRILAVIRGSAINQDGRSNGLTAPNGPSQEAVLRDALVNAGVAAAQIGYVETHGTGTELGDPIELQALGAVMGEQRSADSPLLVGSAKTNVGHLETAAGVTGFIKLVLALQHKAIPPHLHFATPNPHIDWGNLPVRVAVDTTEWLALDGRRIGGVSSFGFSGTNAHVIVEEAPLQAVGTQPHGERAELLCLSARTPTALREMGRQWAARLRDPATNLAAVCHAAAVGRARLNHRAAAVVTSVAGAAAAADQIAAAAPQEGTRLGRAEGSGDERVAFLFTGQGAQYIGMGRRLFETEPVFRTALERCDALLATIGRPLLPVLYPADPADQRLHETAWTQPALFAVQYALAALWRSWGIVPSAVIGHSAGEYAAACIAGMVPMEDALRLLVERARLMQNAPGRGAMAAVFAPEHAVREMVLTEGRALGIAAANAPENTVVSGETDALERVLTEATARGIRHQRLNVSHAFHSHLMEPVLDDFGRAAQAIPAELGTVPLVSNVTGTFLEDMPDAAYWTRHIRQPVRFEQGMRTLLGAGYRVFVELGPHPTLCSLGRQIEPSAGLVWVPSLREGRDDREQMLDGAAALFVQGIDVDWSAGDRERGLQKAELPTYPFERKRYWFEDAATRREPAPAQVIAADATPVQVEREVATSDAAAEAASDPAAELAARIRDAFPDERRTLLEEHVAACVRGVLRLDASDPLDYGKGLLDIGLDSLMAVELRSRLEASTLLPRPLPTTLVFDYPTIAAIARYLYDELIEAAPLTVAELEDSAAGMLDEGAVTALSDQEAEALLLRRLEQFGT